MVDCLPRAKLTGWLTACWGCLLAWGLGGTLLARWLQAACWLTWWFLLASYLQVPYWQPFLPFAGCYISFCCMLDVCTMTGWLLAVRFLAGWLSACWGCLLAWGLAGWLAGSYASKLLAGWLAACLLVAGWLLDVRFLAGWLADWLLSCLQPIADCLLAGGM